MLNSGDICEGAVEALAFGGAGIVRNAHFVVFVPFTAVGDRILYRIVEVKKRYAFGELVDLLTPSTERQTPLCPYFGTCGGCQLQHITYQAQLEHKRQAVEDALKRIGHLEYPTPIPITPSTQVWEYRRHITLTLRAGAEGFDLGYIAVDKRNLVPVECCPIFASPASPLFQQLRTVVRQLRSTPGYGGRVSILKNDAGGYVFTFHFDKIPENTDEVIRRAMASYADWKGVMIHSKIYGEVEVCYTIDELCFRASPEVFVQNNAEQSLHIYRELCHLIPKSGVKVLDLYCGIGISSLLLAKRGCEVLGIEGNAQAIQFAQSSAMAQGLRNAEFLCGDIRRLLGRVLNGQRFDCVILNPPRTGADAAIMELLLAHGPQQVVYISCMPSTLARDLTVLSQGSYHIDTVRAFDMFPQTAHVETLVSLRKA